MHRPDQRTLDNMVIVIVTVGLAIVITVVLILSWR